MAIDTALKQVASCQLPVAGCKLIGNSLLATIMGQECGRPARRGEASRAWPLSRLPPRRAGRMPARGGRDARTPWAIGNSQHEVRKIGLTGSFPGLDAADQHPQVGDGVADAVGRLAVLAFV